ncbi:hypothetical protein LCGC14_1844600, partial [marine sediment metagenome]
KGEWTSFNHYLELFYADREREEEIMRMVDRLTKVLDRNKAII